MVEVASGIRIEHRLGVPAPPEVIWRVISDLEGWSGWNPLYVKAEGALRIGSQLSLTERIEGEHRVIAPTVVDWVPDTQILWKLSEMGGLVRRLRYLEIEKLTDEGSIFSNGEDWSGRFARFAGRGRIRLLRRAYEAMGHAVRERAIALWREEGGGPTS